MLFASSFLLSLSSSGGHRSKIKRIPTQVPNYRTGDVYLSSILVRWDVDPRSSIPFLDPHDPEFWQLWAGGSVGEALWRSPIRHRATLVFALQINCMERRCSTLVSILLPVLGNWPRPVRSILCSIVNCPHVHRTLSRPRPSLRRRRDPSHRKTGTRRLAPIKSALTVTGIRTAWPVRFSPSKI
jgi:hypothetical protein